MKSIGWILWLLLPIECLIVVILSPELDIGGWAIAIGILMVSVWTAGYTSFKKHVHRGIADLVVIVTLFFYKLGRWIYRRIGLKKRLKEIQDSIPDKPPEIATKSVDLARAHPRIMGRKSTVILGYNGSKRPISIDLNSQHTLIGASTGGGKTTLINSILIQIFNKRGRAPEVYIIDLKENYEDALYAWGAVAVYVTDTEKALELLRDLIVKMNKRQKDRSLVKDPIYLIIDEVASLTVGTEDRKYRQSAIRLLRMLGEKSRSANITVMMATQYPRYDILDKSITYNLLRKVCLPVDTSAQAEIVLGFSPRNGLPKIAGEFILKDGLNITRGRSLQVHRSEIDLVLMKHVSGFKEKPLKLWKVLAVGRRIGDTVPGVKKTYEAHRKFGQNFVKFGYRHLALAGVLIPPKARGESNRIAVEFLAGIPLIKQYMEADKWTGEPEPFIKMEQT